MSDGTSGKLVPPLTLRATRVNADGSLTVPAAWQRVHGDPSLDIGLDPQSRSPGRGVCLRLVVIQMDAARPDRGFDFHR